ncbi:hypothetical protein OC834_006845 [Tilletia horrida]|nr:hypothetical protein OC834_006845 [Tilletia horrida]
MAVSNKRALPTRESRFTEEAKLACERLRSEIALKSATIASRFNLSLSDIRIRLGYSTEVGREPKPEARFSHWLAKTSKDKSKQKDLAQWGAYVREEWAAINRDPVRLEATSQSMMEFERDERLTAPEASARSVFQKVRRRANKFASLSSNNDGVAAIVFIASPHAMVPARTIGHPHAIEMFRSALHKAENAEHLRKLFEVNIHKKPLPAARRLPLVDQAAPTNEDSDEEGADLSYVRRKCPHKLLQVIRQAFDRHKDVIDTKPFDQHKNRGIGLPYLNLFKILVKCGLYIDGWPTDAAALIVAGTSRPIAAVDQSPADVGTLRVTSGSLLHFNTWVEDDIRSLWRALVRFRRVLIDIIPVRLSCRIFSGYKPWTVIRIGQHSQAEQPLINFSIHHFSSPLRITSHCTG